MFVCICILKYSLLISLYTLFISYIPVSFFIGGPYLHMITFNVFLRITTKWDNDDDTIYNGWTIIFDKNNTTIKN